MSKEQVRNLIAEMLDQYNLLYYGEYTFDGLTNEKGNYLLRFDFYLPVYNVAIEYNGKQHYEPIKGGQEAFERLQENDQRKRDWCYENGIDLFTIRYDEDIEEKTLQLLNFLL